MNKKMSFNYETQFRLGHHYCYTVRAYVLQNRRPDFFFSSGPLIKKQQFLIVESTNKLIVESTNKNDNFDELKGL